MIKIRKEHGIQNPANWAPFVLIGVEDCELNSGLHFTSENISWAKPL
jgi:hypothetical protein